MITITAKCIVCGHVWQMSAEDVNLAGETGCATCEKCRGPATVEKAVAS